MASNNGHLLQVTDLHKSYRKGGTTIDVLAGASFVIDRGDMVSVIGKSGTRSKRLKPSGFV